MLAVRGTLFFFIFFIFCTTTKGQNYIVDHLTVEDGLPSNWVDAVFEDEDGFIWIGTTQGFARYDGQKITSYFSNWKDSTSLMVSPWVTNIQAHNEHSLIIFKGGSKRIFSKGEDFFRTPEIYSFPSKKIEVLPDSFGIDSYYEVKTNSGQSICFFTKSRESFIRTVFPLHEDYIYMQTKKGEEKYYRISTGEYKSIPFWLNKMKDNEKVFPVGVDFENKLWYATDSQIVQLGYDLNKISGRFPIKFSKSYLSSNSGRGNGRDILWYFEDGVKFYELRTKKTFFIPSEAPFINGFEANNVRAIFKDSKGRYWVGTGGHGLYVVDFERRNFSKYVMSDTLYSKHKKEVVFGSSIEISKDTLLALTNFGLCYIALDENIMGWLQHPSEFPSHDDISFDRIIRSKGEGGDFSN